MGFNRLLPDFVVDEIRESYARAPRSHRAVANEYGCSKNVVRKVLLGLPPYDTGYDHAVMRTRHRQSLRRRTSAVGRYECQHPDPLIKRLYDLINRERVLLRDVTERAGLGRDAVWSWGRRRQTPSAAMLNAAYGALGYKLVPVRDDPDQPMTVEENQIYLRGYRAAKERYCGVDKRDQSEEGEIDFTSEEDAA